MKLWWDFETYSTVDIRCGIYKYCEGVELLIVYYAIDDEPPVGWDVTSNPYIPDDLAQALNDADEIWAHNGNNFERIVWEAVYGRNHHVVIPKEKLRDTLVQAQTHGFPGSLDKLSRDVLHLPEDEAKSRDSRRLINLFCKPLPDNRKLRRATRETHPEDWLKFLKYCDSDVVLMRTVHKKLPTINYPNNKDVLEYSIVDMGVNDRGVRIDTEFVNAVLTTLDITKKKLKNKIYEETDGYVDSATKRDKLISYIFENYGVQYDKFDKAIINRELENVDLHPDLRELLLLRKEFNKTSTAKYKAIEKSLVEGDRIRGLYNFSGAGKTGRYSAKIIQIHNLPSRGVPKQEDIEGFIEFTKHGLAEVYTTDILDYASYALRGVIVANPGTVFNVADWSNIEGRLVAWFADETWKIKAFSEFDAGVGPDLYKLSYSRSFDTPLDAVTKDMRQVGKVLELACGYEGGVGAFVAFALAYDIDLTELCAKIYDTLDPILVEQAKNHLEFMKKRNQTYGLTDNVFITCDVLKRAWRLAHPATTALWADIKDGMFLAVRNHELHGDSAPPVTVGKYLKMKVLKHMNRLLIRLPSGRYLNYAHFGIDVDTKQFKYKGIHPLTKKWVWLTTFSGKILENIAQATSADILNHTLREADQRFDMQPKFHVHDEIICESNTPRRDTLISIMCKNPPWAPGLPLAAEGFVTTRYCK